MAELCTCEGTFYDADDAEASMDDLCPVHGDHAREHLAPFDVRESGTVPVIQHVPAFAWRCNACGWLGVGLLSVRQATEEAGSHVWDEHKIAPCVPGNHGDPHNFDHVEGTDAIDKCGRCGWEIGK